MSAAEARLWVMLRTEQFRPAHFRRQVPIGPYYADFASHTVKLVVEVDGSQHSEDAAIERDVRRDEYLRAEGYRVARVAAADVLHRLDEVGAAILAAMTS
jgi:very-short-patch-repair endonuclease